MSDPILEEVWRVGEELFQKYGGADGLFKHLQQLDRARLRRARQRRARKGNRRNSKNNSPVRPKTLKSGPSTKATAGSRG